ncbi:hypothetical protein MOB78_12520 [Bacillus spizizenii]|nr:hypothetical protein [Bacillus spizizenii]
MNLVDMYAASAEQYRKNRLEEQRKNSNANRNYFAIGDQVEAFLVAPDGERMSLGVVQPISADFRREGSPIYTLGLNRPEGPREGDIWVDDSRNL